MPYIASDYGMRVCYKNLLVEEYLVGLQETITVNVMTNLKML